MDPQHSAVQRLRVKLPLLVFLCFALVLSILVSVTNASDGLFVAVGYGGRRISSTDGAHWENDQRWSDESKDDDNVLFNIAFGFDRFIAVGGGARVGHILSSQDGITWKSLGDWKGRVATIAFGGGTVPNRMVAGHDSQLLVSTDGEQFTPGAKLPIPGSIRARRSAFGSGEGGSRFVIIGDVDHAVLGRRVSWRAATEDGISLQSIAVDSAPASDIAYGSGHFVVVGPDGLIESSHDGQNWQRRASEPDANFSHVTWTGTRFIATGAASTWSSSDAITWSREKSHIPGSVGWGREPGHPLGIGFAWDGHLLSSRDFIEWKRVPLSPGPSFQAVAFGRPK